MAALYSHIVVEILAIVYSVTYKNCLMQNGSEKFSHAHRIVVIEQYFLILLFIKIPEAL